MRKYMLAVACALLLSQTSIGQVFEIPQDPIRVTQSDAQKYITNFSTLDENYGYPTSLLIRADNIRTLIAKTNVKCLQVYFGYDISQHYRLTILIVGVNGNGKHIYFKDAAGAVEASILEHCVPCPECGVTKDASVDLMLRQDSTGKTKSGEKLLQERGLTIIPPLSEIPLSEAKSYIGKFQKKIPSNYYSSFLINVTDVKAYLNAEPTIKYLQFYFGIPDPEEMRVNLYMIGVNEDAQHVPYTVGGTKYLLGNFKGCPSCYTQKDKDLDHFKQ